MKRILLSSILFFSSQVFSETYICSQELSNFGRPGEVETTIFERNGESFNYEFEGDKRLSKFEITSETETLIILTDVFGDNLDIVFLDKVTKEFGRRFLNMGSFRNSSFPPTYGKCVVVN